MFKLCSNLNKRFVRQYSSQITDEYVLSVKNSLLKSQITQESMLLKLDQLVPLKDSFAVVQVGGHQYKLTEGDEFMVESLDADLLAKLLLDKVLLVGTKDHTVVGKPILSRAKVLVEVQEHSKTEKIILFQRNSKKRKIRRGHRQPYTLLKVLDIMIQKE